MKRPLFLTLFGLAIFGGGLALYFVVSEQARRARHEGPAQYQLLPAAAQALEAPGQMTLYSLDPEPYDLPPPRSELFHAYLILGETSVPAPPDRQRVAQELQQAVAAADGPPDMCFNPRHGVRVTRDSKTFDFLICFECDAIYTFAGESRVDGGALHGTPTAMNEILRAANVPLAPPPKPQDPVAPPLREALNNLPK